MKVFNLYGKLLRKNFGSVIAYIIAFMVICTIFIQNNKPATPEFSEERVYVTLINNDEDTPVVNGLTKYLEKYVMYKDVKEENIADALYFREIYIAITIPEGFTNKLLNGEDVHLSTESVPDSVGTISITQAIDKYLNLVTLYNNNLSGEDLSTIIANVNQDLTNETNVTTSQVVNNALGPTATFFNFLSYLFFSVIISIVGIVSLRVKQIDIKRRMAVSPNSQTKINLQLLLGNFITTVIIVTIMSIISFLLYPESMNTKNGALFIINAFCVAMAILSFGYMLSLLIKKMNTLGAAVNVLSLGTSFLAGAFIPQFLLSEGMLKFAHILPNYYYVYNNEHIALITDFSWKGISHVVTYMGIELLFALGFIIISILISKKQSRQEA